MKEFGIDISAHKKNFDFAKAVTEGVKFIIPRGAYSSPDVIQGGGRDTAFVDFYDKTVAAGLPVGTYQYGMARTEEEALAEAKYFEEKALSGRKFDLPVYYDMEDARQKAVNRDILTRVAKTWCDYLESRGYWVGIYASRSFFENHLNDAELQRYAHWVAEWTKNFTYKGNEGVCGLWQFGGETNKIRSNIVAGQVVDQNYLLIDYPSKIRAAGLNGFVKAETSTPERAPAKTLDELVREVLEGKWGNGTDRKSRLTSAGYNYAAVQARVEEILAENNAPAKKEPAKGDAVKLSKCPLYASSAIKIAANKLTGTYYIWSAEQINGRIRITNKKNNVGKAGQVTGWIDVTNV